MPDKKQLKGYKKSLNGSFRFPLDRQFSNLKAPLFFNLQSAISNLICRIPD